MTADARLVLFIRRLRTWLLYAQVQDEARRWARRRDQLNRQLLEARLQAAFYGEWRAELMQELIPARSEESMPAGVASGADRAR